MSLSLGLKKQSKDSKPPKSVMPPKLFDSIKNLTVSRWWDIHETNDFSILSKEPQEKNLKKLLFYCYEPWQNIKEQYITEFGITTKSKQYYAAVSKVAILTCRFSLSQDKMDGFWLKLAKVDLEGFEKQEKQSNFKTKSIVENILGRDYIDPEKVKVIDFYHYVELAQQKAKDGKRRS